MALRIIEKRAKLLGLYPEQGKQSALAVSVTSGDGPQSTIKLEFVSPSLDRWRDEDADPPRPPPRDVSPQPEPRRDYAQPDPPIVVDATILPQNSGVPWCGRESVAGWKSCTFQRGSNASARLSPAASVSWIVAWLVRAGRADVKF